MPNLKIDAPIPFDPAIEGGFLHAENFPPFFERVLLSILDVFCGVFMACSSPVARLFGLSRKSIANTPFKVFYALRYGCMANPGFNSPIHNALCFSVMGKHNGSLLIYLLRSLRDPSAIFRTISKIVVNPVKRMRFGWPWPHVGIEVLERSPSFTNRNTPSSVAVKEFVRRVLASNVHGIPRNKLRGVCHSMMGCGAPLARLLKSFLLSPSELTSFADLLSSAVASTKPKLLTLVSNWGLSFRHYKPFSETLSRQVYRVAHEVAPDRYNNLQYIGGER